jgi:methylthioxylose transferase
VGVAALAAGLVAGRRLVAGAGVTAVGFLLSYALPLATLWAVLLLPRRSAARAAAYAALGAAALLVVLIVAAGYDPLGAVSATHDAYERGIGGRRPQVYWAIAGPAAFLLMLGPVLAERALRSIETAARGARPLLACVALGVASGVMEAEVERLWQFMVPLAAVCAATVTPRRWAAFGIATGALQALVVELRWDTTF